MRSIGELIEEIKYKKTRMSHLEVMKTMTVDQEDYDDMENELLMLRVEVDELQEDLDIKVSEWK